MLVGSRVRQVGGANGTGIICLNLSSYPFGWVQIRPYASQGIQHPTLSESRYLKSDIYDVNIHSYLI